MSATLLPSARPHKARSAPASGCTDASRQQLLSPVSPSSQKSLSKRKRSSRSSPCPKDCPSPKRTRTDLKEYQNIDPQDPVSHWATTGHWPRDYTQKDATMSDLPSIKRKASTEHHSSTVERLGANGIYLGIGTQVDQWSKDLCLRLLASNHRPTQFPCYPAEKVSDVLERIENLNEARLQRDVTPWVVPSAENLAYSDAISPKYLGEEVNAPWSRCATMGGTEPKPDYVAGLPRESFSIEERAKLNNYATATRPWLCTHNLAYPFLVCEAKTGEGALGKADRQSMHAASIAVKSILELYKAAFGASSDQVRQLHGRILVFSVVHDNKSASIYGHYALPRSDDAEHDFRRYCVDNFHFFTNDGAHRFKTYNFVFNLYQEFAAIHRERIRDAVASLASPTQRTGLSFNASQITVSEENSSQGDETFKRPALPSNVLETKIDSLTAMMVQQKEHYEQEITQQRRDNEQQRRDSERQRQDLEKQITQLQEIISLLKRQSA